eukprot:COSAG03_NODE_595_length_6813_cov_18.358505_5_plen_61_part_00
MWVARQAGARGGAKAGGGMNFDDDLGSESSSESDPFGEGSDSDDGSLGGGGTEDDSEDDF